MPKRILFFIEALCEGGKERRFLELMHYLKARSDYEMQIVVMDDEIYYNSIYDLNIPILVIKRKNLKKAPGIFFRFFDIARKFNPDIIHSWGVMTAFYAIPTKIILNRPLVANLIADAKKDFRRWSLSGLFFTLSCYFSDKILANSLSGLKAYSIHSPKSLVIYNGVRLERFREVCDPQKIRQEMDIQTKFSVIMVASFTKRKNYDFFIDVAREIGRLRNDITFIGVGEGPSSPVIKSRISTEKITNVILTGSLKNVEDLISACDIGVLFPDNNYHSEGISNSIIEYMALGKPVLSTDINGGSREIIDNNNSGYIVNNDLDVVVEKLTELLNSSTLRKMMGDKGREIIKAKFPIERMGEEFIRVYSNF